MHDKSIQIGSASTKSGPHGLKGMSKKKPDLLVAGLTCTLELTSVATRHPMYVANLEYECNFIDFH